MSSEYESADLIINFMSCGAMKRCEPRVSGIE